MPLPPYPTHRTLSFGAKQATPPTPSCPSAGGLGGARSPAGPAHLVVRLPWRTLRTSCWSWRTMARPWTTRTMTWRRRRRLRARQRRRAQVSAPPGPRARHSPLQARRPPLMQSAGSAGAGAPPAARDPQPAAEASRAAAREPGAPAADARPDAANVFALAKQLTRSAALLLLREGRARRVWPAAGANGAPAVAETGAASASEAFGAGCAPPHLADLSRTLCNRRCASGATRLFCHSVSVGRCPRCWRQLDVTSSSPSADNVLDRRPGQPRRQRPPPRRPRTPRLPCRTRHLRTATATLRRSRRRSRGRHNSSGGRSLVSPRRAALSGPPRRSRPELSPRDKTASRTPAKPS